MRADDDDVPLAAQRVAGLEVAPRTPGAGSARGRCRARRQGGVRASRCIRRAAAGVKWRPPGRSRAARPPRPAAATWASMCCEIASSSRLCRAAGGRSAARCRTGSRAAARARRGGARAGRAAAACGRQRPGAAVEPALAVAGAERAGGRRVRLGLDALGQHEGAGALGLGVDRVDDAAIAGDGRSWTSRRSSLMTSGSRNGISASERGSAPTSSSAIAQAGRAQALDAGSISAGRSVSARSVSSNTMSSRARAASSSSAHAAGRRVERRGLDVQEQAGGRRRPASSAPRRAAARHAHSSSVTTPGRAGGGEQRAGRSSGVPSGPRASAS